MNTAPRIINNTESDEYYFEEGCFIWELSNSNNDEALSIARARVLPNTATKLHTLAHTIERYIILEGKGDVTLGETTPVSVSAGDVIIIPENCPQAICNTGNQDLVFMVLCTPRFVIENYQECTA
jgi:mannose-6-phosphate isomerase-like protein (cupin superfamily)